jgi:hypothetical protein
MMRERQVTETIAEKLKSEGLLNLRFRIGNEHGPDIEGRLPQSRRWLFIEAKGEPGSKEKSIDRRMRLGEALLQVLTVYDHDVVCAIALPYNEGYETLVRKILAGIGRLGVHILLVRGEDVWHLAPDAKGFFPTKVKSLLAELDK